MPRSNSEKLSQSPSALLSTMRVLSHSHRAQALEVSGSLPIPLATRSYFYLFLLILVFIPSNESSATCFSLLWVTPNTENPEITPLLHRQHLIHTVTSFIYWVKQSKATESSDPNGWQQREKQYLKDRPTWGNLQQSACISGSTRCAAGVCSELWTVPLPPVPTLPAHSLPGATVQGSHTASAARNDT